jgi:succinoglycan biosynthesis transport protein ExoP
MPENGTPGMNGKPARPGQVPSVGTLGRTPVHGPAVERGTRLAAMATRQLGGGPGTPGGWSRFLLAHLRWILVVTLIAVGAAAGYVRHQTPQYQAQAAVNVWFASASPAALQGPNMVTEKGIVSSGAILGIASRILGVTQSVLLRGLSVNVPAGSSIMNVAYADPVPWIARDRAQVIAEAYVHYRSPPPTPAGKGSKAAAQVVSTLRATLITPATLPRSPSSPNSLVDILAALVVGLGLAIGSAALRDHLDDRFRGPLDLEARTGAAVLALVPAFRTASRAAAAELALLWNPDSVVAEAYRSLRTRVLTEAAARGARTLLVTSPGWEKKGTVAANLAVALAQSGRRTILVCADLRWGSTHELFGVRNDEGLTTLLDARADCATALQKTVVANLQLLPPGPLPSDPAEILQRTALRTVIGGLRSQADFVIIEAPPILASPDFSPLAQRAEMMLLVGDARKSTRAHLQAALREAGDAASKLVGCALYNVGRRRWLRRSPEPLVVTDPPLEADEWSGRDTVDGHEVAFSQQHATYVSLPAGDSPSWPPDQA